MLGVSEHRFWCFNRRIPAALSLCASTILFAACSNAPVIPPPSEQPLSKETLSLLGKKGIDAGAPIFIRIFKQESELEVWKQRDDARYYHFKTYPICNWSGELGPKIKQGDRQAPEGFYSVNAYRMNPNSSYYLAFNLGYPNAYDKSWGRTGDALMIHGKCKSAGCYAMTDALMEEIYGLTREALKAGQTTFQVHAMPFRMTDAKMAEVKGHKWAPFWKQLKQGYDHFEKYRMPPEVAVCERRYVVNVVTPNGKIDSEGRCPSFRRHQLTAFTPMPTEEALEATRLVENGAKLKGIANPDAEPTAADIATAKVAPRKPALTEGWETSTATAPVSAGFVRQ